MISRQAFKMLLAGVQAQMETDHRIGRAVDTLGDVEMNNNHRFVFTTPLIEATLQALIADMHDKWGHISYFIYDTDWGKKADDYNITLANGEVIKFYDAGYLYDYLVKEAAA